MEDDGPVAEAVNIALGYAGRGWPVFPVSGKIPLTPNGSKDATTDPKAIAGLWRGQQDAGVGIATGNGLVVLDIDPGKGGEASLEELLAGAPVWDTPTVLTGGGGLHFYFHTDTPRRNRAGILPGVDVRGDGGYVVAAGSPHPSGKRYEWDEATKDRPLAPWPEELDAASTDNVSAEPVPAQGIPEGSRNQTLASLAGSMRRRGFSPPAIESALVEENKRCQPPLPDVEVRTIARSVSRYKPEDEPAPDGLMSMRSSDFLTQEIPTPRYLVDRIWPEEAVGFVAGPSGSFKSWYVLEMGFAIATGKPFLAEFPTVQATVLYIQSESGRGAFKERVEWVGKRYGDAPMLYLVSNVHLNLEDPANVERIRHELESVRPALLILDPLASFLHGDENSSQSMGGVVRALRQMRDDYGCAIAVVHHSQKGASADSELGGKHMRGSSALDAGKEVGVWIHRIDDATPRSSVKYYLKEGEPLSKSQIQFDSSTRTLRYVSQTQMIGAALAGRTAPRTPYWTDDE